MRRRTFLSLLGAVAWPWKKKAQAGPTSSTFTLPSDGMGGWSAVYTPSAHNDAEAFRRAIAETRPIDLSSGNSPTIRIFHNVSYRRIEAGRPPKPARRWTRICESLSRRLNMRLLSGRQR